MTDSEIEDMDRAITVSMANGTFGLRPDTPPANSLISTNNNNNNKGPEFRMTGDRLWSLGSQQTYRSGMSEEASSSGYRCRPVSAPGLSGRHLQQLQLQQRRQSLRVVVDEPVHGLARDRRSVPGT